MAIFSHTRMAGFVRLGRLACAATKAIFFLTLALLGLSVLDASHTQPPWPFFSHIHMAGFIRLGCLAHAATMAIFFLTPTWLGSSVLDASCTQPPWPFFFSHPHGWVHLSWMPHMCSCMAGFSCLGCLACAATMAIYILIPLRLVLCI